MKIIITLRKVQVRNRNNLFKKGQKKKLFLNVGTLIYN